MSKRKFEIPANWVKEKRKVSWRERNKEKVRDDSREYQRQHPEVAWEKNLWKKYKITSKDYSNMSLAQQGRCAICRETETALGGREKEKKAKRLAVDHDKVTGKVRGLLCQKCNLRLGDYEIIKKTKFDVVAEKYLNQV